MNSIRAIAVLSLGVLAQAQAADGPPSQDQFEWRETVLLEKPGQAVYRFELPPSVYAGTRRQDLGDLRVFNVAGEVVPHALLHYEAPARVELKLQPLPFFLLHRTAGPSGGGIEVAVRETRGGTLVATRVNPGRAEGARRAGYIVDASAVAAARRDLVLAWQPQARGTVLRVSVEAGDDLQHWQPVSAGSQLVDIQSGDQRLRQDRIGLAGSSAKYIRILWAEGQEGIELSSAAIEIGGEPVRPSRLRWSPAGAMAVGAAAGEFLFESPGLPLEALQLRLPERNTVVPVTLFHRRDDKAPWQPAASTVAYRLSRDGEELVSPPIALCCSTDRFWRLVFDQRGGGIGQGQPQAELGWTPQQGLFVARGAEPFSLAYGSPRIGGAGFTAAALVPAFRPEMYPTFPEARFDAPVRQTAAPRVPEAPPPWRSIGLWSVLVAGVLLLGAMVWRLVGQMGKGGAAAD